MLEPSASTGQKYASVTEEQSNLLLTVSFILGGRKELELDGKSADEIVPRCHERTHENHLMFLLVTKEMGFFTCIPHSEPAARCHGNRKAVERVNCLSPVFRFSYNSICSLEKKKTAKNYLRVCACVCVHAFRVYLRFPHRRVNASIISRFSSKREREKADMVMDEEHA